VLVELLLCGLDLDAKLLLLRLADAQLRSLRLLRNLTDPSLRHSFVSENVQTMDSDWMFPVISTLKMPGKSFGMQWTKKWVFF
jgi:hypothetical protein